MNESVYHVSRDGTRTYIGTVEDFELRSVPAKGNTLIMSMKTEEEIFQRIRLEAADLGELETRMIARRLTDATAAIQVATLAMEFTAVVDHWEQFREAVRDMAEATYTANRAARPAYPGAGDPYDHTKRQRKRRRK